MRRMAIVIMISLAMVNPVQAKVISRKAPKNIYSTVVAVKKVKKVKGKKYFKITAKDAAGRVWAWYDNNDEDWQKNDFAALTMNNNGTKIVYDDIILDARYCGSKKFF